jgi:regulatory protein
MSNALESAVRLLTRREHSAKELSDKLKQKGFSTEEINEVLASCQRLDLQSDERFVECYVRSRIRQGYGPLKISQELKLKGVDSALISKEIKQEGPNWLTYALNVWEKKCKGQINLSFQETQKQQRFLLYRGFDIDIISQVVKECDRSP